MSSFPFNVVAGSEINQNIGFAPTAVIVNNYSPYYIYFADGLSFCPPWTSGAIISLAHATQARASWLSTPFGEQTISPPLPEASYTASFSFTDEEVGLSGGTAVINPYSLLERGGGAASGGSFNYNIGGISNVHTVKGLQLNAVMVGAVGNVGYAALSLISAPYNYLLADGFLVPGGILTLALTYPEPLSIVSIPGAWTIRLSLNDWVGVSQYYGVGTVLYS